MSEPATPGVPETSKTRPRKYERCSCRVKMRCRRAKSGPAATEEKYIEGLVRNQSVGGLLLESPIYQPVGAKLEVAFNSPDDRQSFLGVVTVKWCRRVGNFWFLGVSTDRMDKF